MASSLKKEFLELLEKDIEFRYTVAGYLGLSEILKKLDKLEENQQKLWENQYKLWEEIKALREDQNKLWENQNRLWENQNKLWEEVKALREGQNKLWENQNKLWESQNKLWQEVRSLRENQEKLWEEVRSLREGQNKLWEEVRSLRESQEKLWEEVRSLREGQNKLWEEVKSLREGQNKLWENQEKLWQEVRSLRESQNKLLRRVINLERSFKTFYYKDFRELGRAVGMTLEHYAASFLRMYLRERGYPEEKTDVRAHEKFMINDREIEVDVFNKDPLIVGEVTTYIRDEQEAKNEVEKLLKKKEIIETIYKRKVEMLILAVANIEPHALEFLKEITKKENIKLLTGREIRSKI